MYSEQQFEDNYSVDYEVNFDDCDSADFMNYCDTYAYDAQDEYSYDFYWVLTSNEVFTLIFLMNNLPPPSFFAGRTAMPLLFIT